MCLFASYYSFLWVASANFSRKVYISFWKRPTISLTYISIVFSAAFFDRSAAVSLRMFRQPFNALIFILRLSALAAYVNLNLIIFSLSLFSYNKANGLERYLVILILSLSLAM